MSAVGVAELIASDEHATVQCNTDECSTDECSTDECSAFGRSTQRTQRTTTERS